MLFEIVYVQLQRTLEFADISAVDELKYPAGRTRGVRVNMVGHVYRVNTDMAIAWIDTWSNSYVEFVEIK